MNCGLQFGQVVVWCSHKSTWQQSSSASDRACHRVASDVNTRGARGKRGGGVKEGWKEVQLISWMEHEHEREKKNQLLKHIMYDHRKWMQPPEALPLRRCFLSLPIARSFFSVAFLAAIKRQNKNYAATPLWLPDNNPLLLLCASFIL